MSIRVTFGAVRGLATTAVVSALVVAAAAPSASAGDLQVRVDGLIDLRIAGPFPEIRVSVPDIYIGLAPPKRPARPRPVAVTAPQPPPLPDAFVAVPEDPPGPGFVAVEEDGEPEELVEEHCIELPYRGDAAPAPTTHRRVIRPPTADPVLEAPGTTVLVEQVLGHIDAPPTPGTSAVDGDFQAVEARVMQLVNQIRAAHGLSPLQHETRLQQAAIYHAEEMYRLEYVGHDSPVDAHHELPDRLSASGIYDYGVAGENLALTPDSADLALELIRMWMASSAHRAGILAPEYSFTGVGVYGAGDRVLAVQVFTSRIPSFERASY